MERGDRGKMPNEETLLLIPPELRKCVEELYTSKSLTLIPKPMSITIGQKNRKEFTDRFRIALPYGGNELHWEISYELEDERFVPDFEFINDTFLIDPDINFLEVNIPSLSNWNINNPVILLSTISEFLQVYKKYNMARFKEEYKFTKGLAEYMQLLENSQYAENDIEVYIDKDDHLHLLILLKINLDDLVYYAQEQLFECAGEDAAFLKMTYYTTKVSSNLILSPRLEYCINKMTDLQMPSYTADEGLTGYVNTIETIMKESLDNAKKQYNARKEFVNTAIACKPNHLLTYDCAKFIYVHFLIEVDEFPCLLLMQLNEKFPKEQPMITLRSTQHIHRDRACATVLEGCPYSPRWSYEQMIITIFAFAETQIPKFKNECDRNT